MASSSLEEHSCKNEIKFEPCNLFALAHLTSSTDHDHWASDCGGEQLVDHDLDHPWAGGGEQLVNHDLDLPYAGDSGKQLLGWLW